MNRKFMPWLRGNHGENGQAMVMTAAAMIVLLGFAAFAVDIGHVAVVKSDLQNAADAAALAGAADLPNSTAANKAFTYAQSNGMTVQNNHVTTDGQRVDADIIESNTKVKVICSKEVDYYFAGVLGFESKVVTAVAVAKRAGSASGMSGLRPWALKNTYTYTYGLQFVLKVGGGGGSQGYYGIVGYGTQNANSSNVYKDNITNGYNGVIKIGDVIKAGSGNINVKTVINALLTKSGDTAGDYTKATPGNSRVVIIPKIDVSTKKITGFAAIYLKSVDNQGYITANFLYDTSWPQAQQDLYEDWGLQANTKLTE